MGSRLKRAVFKSSDDPPNDGVSVRTEIADAPLRKYAFVTSSTDDQLLIIPFDGDFLLNSAIMPVLSGSVRNSPIEKISLVKCRLFFQKSNRHFPFIFLYLFLFVGNNLRKYIIYRHNYCIEISVCKLVRALPLSRLSTAPA